MYCAIAASSPVTLRIAMRSHSVRSRYAAMSVTDEPPSHRQAAAARPALRSHASLRAGAALRRTNRERLQRRIDDAKSIVGFDERRPGRWITKGVLVPAEARQEERT